MFVTGPELSGQLKTIIFDMDGTLTDTMRLQPYLIQKYLVGRKTGSVLSFSQVQRRMAVIYYLNHFTWFKVRSVPLFLRQFEVSLVRFLFNAPIVVLQYLRAIRAKERTFFGTADMLRVLKNRGYILGLATNGRKFEVNRKIKSLLNLFDFVITSSDVRKKKPSPEMLLKAMKLAKSRPEESVFVGDTLVDMLAARNAGMHFLLVTTGTFGPSVVRIGSERPKSVIKSIQELEHVLSGPSCVFP